MDIKRKKDCMNGAYRMGILVFDGVLSSEVTGPAEVFALAAQQEFFKGSSVLLIGVNDQAFIRTEEGLGLMVDAHIDDDLQLDLILVPGANDMQPLLHNIQIRDFLQKHAAQDSWMTSVCAGAFLLGQAGLLNGKQATTWYGGENDLQEQFPNIHVVHDRPLVLDRRRMTANGGLVSYQAALVLVGKLSSADHAKAIYDSLGLARLQSWAAIEELIEE